MWLFTFHSMEMNINGTRKLEIRAVGDCSLGSQLCPLTDFLSKYLVVSMLEAKYEKCSVHLLLPTSMMRALLSFLSTFYSAISTALPLHHSVCLCTYPSPTTLPLLALVSAYGLQYEQHY